MLERSLAGGGRLGARYLCQLGLRRLPRTVGQRLRSGEVVQIVQETLESQVGEERLQPVEVRCADGQLLGPEIDGDIQTDGREPLGEAQFVAPGCDAGALPPLDFREVVQQILHRTPLLHELAGPLLADARHARNVVRRIAPDRQDVAHQHGVRNAVLFADRRRVDHLDAVALLLVELAVLAHQLPVVLVGGHHEDLVARFGPLAGQRADHVVGLVTLHLQHRNAHRIQNLLDVGNRKDDVLGGVGPVGLVFGEDLPAETASLRIERYSQQVGFLALEDVAQELDEAEDHGGVHPLVVAHGTPHKGVVVFVNQRIGVDQKEFFAVRHFFSR